MSNDRFMNALISFFAALAEFSDVQVAVLSVLNIPR